MLSPLHLLTLIVSLTSLASSPVIIKWSGANPEAMGFWRLLISALLLSWVIVPLQNRQKITPAALKYSCLAGLFFFLHLWTYMQAAHNTNIAHMVIIYATNPLFATIGSILWLKEKFDRRLIWAYPLAILGIFILMQDRFNQPHQIYGNLMALVSAIFHAGYFLMSQKSRSYLPNTLFSFLLYLVTALLFSASALTLQSSVIVTNDKFILSIGLLVLIPTLLGHFLMTRLMTLIPAAKLSFSKLIEPGISSLLAFMVLKEDLSPHTLVAFTLTSLAVMIVLKVKYQPKS